MRLRLAEGGKLATAMEVARSLDRLDGWKVNHGFELMARGSVVIRFPGLILPAVALGKTKLKLGLVGSVIVLFAARRAMRRIAVADLQGSVDT